MTKKSILAAVTVSALTLSQLGIVSADEVDVVDPTASSEIVVSEDTTSQSSSDVVSPTVPSDTETPIIDDSGSSSTPSTGESTVDNPTVPGISEENPSTTEPTEIEKPARPSQPEDSTTEQTGIVDVPTTDGGTATVTPDTSVPTNNPNITAETAQNAGASQVGTTSTVTGQVVRDVTHSNPVTLYNGASLVDIRDGLVTLSSGEKVTPELVGVTANADGTYTAKTIQGDMVTLPHTGEKNTTILSVLGAFILSVLGFSLKKRNHQES